MKRVHIVVCAAVLTLSLPAQAARATGPDLARLARTHFYITALAQAQERKLAQERSERPSRYDCTAYASPTGNSRLDCDSQRPNLEAQIVVDPTDPNHMIGSSNDLDSCCDEYYTTFDGGATWSTGEMSHFPNREGSDPVTAIDPVTATPSTPL